MRRRTLSPQFSMCVVTTGKIIFLMVLGTETLLSSKLTVYEVTPKINLWLSVPKTIGNIFFHWSQGDSCMSSQL